MAAEISAARLAVLRGLPYPEYLATPEWRRTRDRALLRAGWRCEWPECRERQTLQVHHRTYAHLGEERDHELRVLCSRHHQGVHDQLDGLRRLHWRLLRDVINSGPFPVFADFVDAVKQRFHEEHIAVEWRALNEMLNVSLRDVLIDVPGHGAHQERRPDPPGISDRDARTILAALKIPQTLAPMPEAIWSDPAQLTANYEAARERAYEMGVELSLEEFLR